VGELPAALRAVALALPASALNDLVQAAFAGGTGPGRAWLVLAGWAGVAPAVAARTFRWSPTP